LDMELNFNEVGEHLYLGVTYNSDVYARDMVEGLLVHYGALMDALLSSPAEQLGSVEYLTDEDRYELLSTFNDTFFSYPKDKTMVSLFEDQVVRTPDAVAVVFEGVELTYRELNEQSNQLAHYLREQYVIEADDLIGIQLERSLDMIVSILGVLKSGGAYVPIDTEYPEDRISYILEDSNCKALLDIKELLIFHTLELNYSKENLLKITTPKDLAYVIYTSGSTGQPKGVMIENSQLVSFLNNIRNNLGMMNIKRVAATTVFSFDISILELLGCLLNGSELYIYSDKVIYDPTILLSKLERDQVDFLQVTPSRLRQLFLVNKNLPKTIKTLLIGGDVLSDVFYDQLKNLKYIERIIHVYGPTETTIWSTSIDINSSENINIGKPIGNTSIYILDSALHLCAKGVVGELCIGGDGLARGYLNRADLTCEKFVPNPFVEGDRIYRTGDLARWLPDGNIEFIGRNDDQVKIRGYRIELGEIEHVLESQAFINQAVVLAKEAETGEAVIVCYIVSDSDLNIEVVRDVLSKSLPSYMLPSH